MLFPLKARFRPNTFLYWESNIALSRGLKLRIPTWFSRIESWLRRKHSGAILILCGVWRSWLAHRAGGPVVVGSSPTTPTIFDLTIQ